MPRDNSPQYQNIAPNGDRRWGVFRLDSGRGWVEIGYLWNPESGIVNFEETGLILPEDFEFTDKSRSALEKLLRPLRRKYWCPENAKPQPEDDTPLEQRITTMRGVRLPSGA